MHIRTVLKYLSLDWPCHPLVDVCTGFPAADEDGHMRRSEAGPATSGAVPPQRI